ncbi:MAG: DUF4783 domain-containing protein [Tannerellaceae bacterium]|nr:DUF4783 domain-containing protein [Tannerellaceae bacterium]
MKRILMMIIGLFSYLCIQAADINTIADAFKSGNASTLSTSMDKEIDLAIPGSSKKCDSKEAISLLNNFFSKNKPSTFTVVHHADKKENGFLAGKLPAGTQEYRVNITYRTENNKAIIQSIRIE